MINILILIFTFLIIVFALFDIKQKSVPSVLLTGTLIILVGLRFQNIQWAVLMALSGLLMWEFAEGNESAFGMADLKVITMLGFFISSFTGLFNIMFSVAIAQVAYFTAFKIYDKKIKEIPLIPMFLFVWIIGVIGGTFT